MKGYISIYQITKEKTRKDLWGQQERKGGVSFVERGKVFFTDALRLVTFGKTMPQFAVNKITLFRGQIKAYFSFTYYLLPVFFGMGAEHFTDPA